MPIESVYNKDGFKSELKEITRLGDIVLCEESVTFGSDEPTLLKTAYVNTGMYLGDHVHAEMLINRGITQNFYGDKVACAGFNPIEKKWYGWSHRAIYGFGIGSECVKGDCCYIPSCKEDCVRALKEFWDHGIPRTVNRDDGTTVVFTSEIKNIKHDVVRDGQLGFSYDYDCCGDNGENIGRPNSFEPYPVPWGRGEWTATTLEEARQMAIDFAKGVS